MKYFCYFQSYLVIVNDVKNFSTVNGKNVIFLAVFIDRHLNLFSVKIAITLKICARFTADFKDRQLKLLVDSYPILKTSKLFLSEAKDLANR